MRTEFKVVTIKGNCFLYPVPVVKNHKYLLKVPTEDASLYIKAFKGQLITSPDSKRDDWLELGLHTDGRTSIYGIRQGSQSDKTINQMREEA